MGIFTRLLVGAVSTAVVGIGTYLYAENHYDEKGFNSFGRDRDGYDKEGYDKRGFDRTGYDRTGYDEKHIDREGRDRLGFDREGFNTLGFDRLGYDHFGYDEKGLDRSGYDAAYYRERLLKYRKLLEEASVQRELEAYRYALDDAGVVLTEALRDIVEHRCEELPGDTGVLASLRACEKENLLDEDMIGRLHGVRKLCESAGHEIDAESDITGVSARFVEAQVRELVDAEERMVLPPAPVKKEESVPEKENEPAPEERTTEEEACLQEEAQTGI